MSETTPEAAPATEAAETTTPETPATEAVKPTETVDFWKAKAREQENRAKANAEAARRLQEIEDAQKTEAQRLADRQAEIERERDEARAEGLRYKAAATHGVHPDYFDLLGSGTEEEITARAERVGAFLKVSSEHEQMKAELEALRQGKPTPASGRPTASLKPGASATPVEPAEDDSYPSHWLPQQRQATP